MFAPRLGLLGFAALIGLTALGLIPADHSAAAARRAGPSGPPTTHTCRFCCSSWPSPWPGNVLLLYVWMQQILAAYGRLLFPSLGAIILLIAGLWEFSRDWRDGPGCCRAFWLLPPLWLIRPAYARPPFLDDATLSEKGIGRLALWRCRRAYRRHAPGALGGLRARRCRSRSAGEH